MLKRIKVKNGSIQFWGEWFGGRFGENYHTVIKAYWDKDDVLVIKLDQGEVVTIHNPTNIISNEEEFLIKGASLISFEWFYYGREHTAENLCRLEYKDINDKEILCTGTDIMSNKPYEKQLYKSGLVAMRIA